MGKRVCPWWLGYVLASPVRRLLQNPTAVVQPYVKSGMSVLEPGPGMGFFTLELAQAVGPNGKVVAVDVQPRMIASLKRRLRKAGLLDRVDTRLASDKSLGLDDLRGRIDFTFAMAVVHEMSGPECFFGQVGDVSKPGARVLLAEPAGHVTDAEFAHEIEAANAAGFEVLERPDAKRLHTAVLVKRG